MKRKIFFYLNLTLLFIVSISCVHEQYRSVDTGEDKVFVTFNPTNILTTGTETQINKFRMIAFNSGGTLEFNKKQSEMDSPSKDLYELELRPGMYTLYGIGNEPDELLTQLDEVRTSDVLDALKLGDVRSIPENNLPLIWKRTIYIRATGLDASVGQVSLTNSPDDSGWSSTLPMQMERIAAKISIAARKGNPNEEINMTRVEIKQIPAYTTFAPSVYPAGEYFYSNNFEWGAPKLITGNADSYTELVKGQIVAENLPATEARKTIISIEYTRNGIAESAVIPFEGNVDRNKLYQYQIKITGIQVEIENITVLPWNAEIVDVVIPGIELNFAKEEAPYSLASESKIHFTARNITPENITLSTTFYNSSTEISSKFDINKTKITYQYDPETRIGYGYLTIKRNTPSVCKDILSIYASGLSKSITVKGLDVAGSNVYWDELTNQLAFDDTPSEGEIAPHAYCQGLFFYPGALQAFPAFYDKEARQREYIWSSRGVIEATTIPPYSKITPTSALDPDTGVGDLCVYMTRRGWTPSAPRKKWRLPDPYELTSVKYTIEGVNTPPSEALSKYGLSAMNSWVKYENIIIPISGFVHFLSPSQGSKNDKVNSDSRYSVRQQRTDDIGLRIIRVNYSSGIRDEDTNNNMGQSIRCVVDDSPEAVIPLYMLSYDLSETERSGKVTASTEFKIIKNQHVDAGGSLYLSSDVLTCSEGLIHSGWIIEGIEYSFGAKINNINKDFIAKPRWFGHKINGTVWASSNLISTYTFAEKAEYRSDLNNIGNYFNWNDSDINEISANHSTYDENRDPCPEGWITPSLDDLKSLLSIPSVPGNKNGVNGYWFGINEQPDIKSQADYLFIPLTGIRKIEKDGNPKIVDFDIQMNLVGRTLYASGQVPLFYCNYPNSGLLYSPTGEPRNQGTTIRCVKK